MAPTPPPTICSTMAPPQLKAMLVAMCLLKLPTQTLVSVLAHRVRSTIPTATTDLRHRLETLITEGKNSS